LRENRATKETTLRAKLEFALLGPPQVRLAGQPVTDFKTLKAQALLYYLVVTGQPQTRPSLACLLWGDMPEEQARVNLSKALSDLRTTFSDYIVFERQQIAFNQQSDYWLDLHDLRASADDLCAEARSQADYERLLRKHAATVDLYRGDFLEGFYVRHAPEFEIWMLAERERQRALAVHLLDREVERNIEQGRWQTGIGNVRRLLALEPWREAAHRQLIWLLASSGQRSAALAQFETCRRLLAEELDVEPDASIITLAEQIRAGAFDYRAVESLPPTHGPSSAPPRADFDIKLRGRPAFLDADTEGDQTAPFFVARERELQLLDGHLQTALGGQGRVAFITGEAGAGKTALMQAFKQRAMADHPRLCVAHGICNAYTGTGDPYLPFREIMSMLAGQVEDRWAGGAIDREQALRLWHGIPHAIETFLDSGSALIDTMVDGRGLLERAATYGLLQGRLLDRLAAQVGRQHGQRVEQDQLFRQYGAVLQSLSNHAPLLLILDDLHWADASSLALLFYLGRSMGQSRILILGGYRPEDLASTPKGQPHTLAEVVSEFRRRFGEIEVRLDDRSEADSRLFVNALLDSEPNTLNLVFRQSLYARSRGHPLFIVELLRDMQERGNLGRDADGRWVQQTALAWNALPARVEGVIERRIARLDPALREILGIAAVEGENFTAEVVAQVQGIHELHIVRSLAELDKTHRLVAPAGVERVGVQRLSKYRFRHSLFQQYLYASLSDVERSYLHEWVGHELERLYDGQLEPIAVHLGRHFEAAGQTAKAVGYWLLAGDTAARVYAHAEASASYRRGLELAKERPLVEQLQPLFSNLGRTLELDSQFDQALAAYMDMEATAVAIGNRAMELQALVAQATLYSNYNPHHDLVRGETVSKRALELAKELENEAAEAKILGNLIVLYSNACRWEQTIASGQRSIEIARRIGLSEQLAMSLNDLGSHCYATAGQLALAQEVLAEARDLWQKQENLPMLADNLAVAAEIDAWTGHYDRALRSGQEALRISQAIENLWGQSHSQYRLGWVHWERGADRFGPGRDRELSAPGEALRLWGAAGGHAGGRRHALRRVGRHGARHRGGSIGPHAWGDTRAALAAVRAGCAGAGTNRAGEPR
jgi:DNA-binding SARP family transcriptional activator